jgi:hypothetical protein
MKRRLINISLFCIVCALFSLGRYYWYGRNFDIPFNFAVLFAIAIHGNLEGRRKAALPLSEEELAILRQNQMIYASSSDAVNLINQRAYGMRTALLIIAATAIGFVAVLLLALF